MNKLTLTMFKAVKVTKNIRRLFRDIRRRARRQDTSDQANRVTLMVTVTEREQFLQSELLKQLQKIPGNRRQLSAFIHEELNREDNCTHFLIIEGLTTDQLHILVHQLGQNPHAFLSDDRGENGGRIVIDNSFFDGHHPFMDHNDPDYLEEAHYWLPAFPSSPKWTHLNTWMMSRTHGLIYTVIHQGKEMILLPVHVDPKNVVVTIRDLFHRFHPHEHHALSYHDISVPNDLTYRGTGLYRLGCNIFLYLLKKAERQGLIKKLVILGSEEEIKNDISIVRGDRITWQQYEFNRAHLANQRTTILCNIMWLASLIAVAVLRLTTPIYILLHPYWLTLASLLLDASDGYLAFRAKWTHHAYHIFDKLMDYWWYIWILIYSTELTIFPVIFILFIYRTIGQIVSVATYKPITLAWFPNVLENYFIACLIAAPFPMLRFYFIDRLQIYPLIICAIIALIREYIIHIRKITIGNYLFRGLNFHWDINSK